MICYETCAPEGCALRGLPEQCVEDAIQETWARVLALIATGRIEPARFEGLLFAIARNVRGDILRARERDMRGAVTASNEIAAPHGDPVEWLENLRRVERAVDALPDNWRIPLVLRHEKGLSYKEIGKRLGISPKAVELRLRRARRRLLEFLAD